MFGNRRTCCVCRQVSPSVVIHHIDGNRDNNVAENLAVLCPNCHSNVHSDAGLGRRFTQGELLRYKGDWEARNEAAAGLAVAAGQTAEEPPGSIWEENGRTYARYEDHILCYWWKTQDLVAVDIRWDDGSHFYVETDLEGNVSTCEPRFGLSAYSLSFAPGQIKSKAEVPLADGLRRVTYVLQDDRVIDVVLDPEGRIQQLSGSCARFNTSSQTVSFPSRQET